MELIQQIDDAIKFLRSRTALVPQVAVVLGSGLSGLTDEVEIEASIGYDQIPHFPVSTVEGHRGHLVFGRWNGKNVVMMAGRFHYYEGYSLQQVTFPVRVMKFLGAQSIVITNASGGLNPDFRVGDLVLITDHINLNSDHPLRGKNHEQLGPRFPDQHHIYDRELIERAEKIAKERKFGLRRGVYVGVTGPTFETPAEYRFLRLIGGDAVGMSTVPEVIVANHMGMRILCLTVITDEGNPEVPQKVTHEEVVKAANEAKPRMQQILREMMAHL
jgi:purine-nucleoside phosphorylase